MSEDPGNNTPPIPSPIDCDWKSYYEARTDFGPNGFLVESIDYVTHKDSACDIGAGAMVDAHFLVEVGFKEVTTIDNSESYKELVKANTDPRIKAVVDDLDLCELPLESYDLVSAQQSLHFGLATFAKGNIDTIKKSLKSGGVLIARIFGNEHALHEMKPDGFFPTAEVLREYIGDDVEILIFEESKQPGKSQNGTDMFSHLFKIVARKK